MDRYLLTAWGQGLTEEPFAQALAALGALAALPAAQLAAARTADGWATDALVKLLTDEGVREEGVWRWVLPAISVRQAQPRLAVRLAGTRRMVDAPPATLLSAVWQRVTGQVSHTSGVAMLRLAVQEPAFKPSRSTWALAQLMRRAPRLLESDGFSVELPLGWALAGPKMGARGFAHAKPPESLPPEPTMAGAEPPEALPPESAMVGAEPQEPAAAVPRFVQQQSFRKVAGRFVETRSGYVVGQPVRVRVRIGPPHTDAVVAPQPFPEELLPRDREVHQLSLVFHEPTQLTQPLIKTLRLPRVGDSSVVSFVFTPQVVAPFAARLSVLHRGRVLQTVLLHTRVVATDAALADGACVITLDMETQVHHDWSDLGQRRPFDMAVVLNHTQGGQPLLTGVAGRRAWATNLQGIEQPVRRINELISAVAQSVQDYGDGLDQGENPALLVQLARVGVNLYSLLYRDHLQRYATDGLDVGDESVTYLQVVSARLDAVVPLEFMYDFNPPTLDATVCPQHREALEKGHCPGNCARASKPRAYVCPMGFWGLKKVIERHMYDSPAGDNTGPALVLQVEALEGRDQLHLGSGALVAHSQEVKPDEVAPLVALLSAKMGSPVPVVKNWDDWLATVKINHPALLVAFPHNEGSEQDMVLEIGGDKFETFALTPDYLRSPRQPAPLVFLLGCDVAGTAQDFSSHIRFFRQAGAAVVVCTIATVFGAHAVRVGQAMVMRMLQPGVPGQARIGEMLRDAKRAALLDSVPMALCVVAFGDADWRL